jgi:hypothetical protein
MLVRATANQIWQSSLELTAIFVAVRLPVAAGFASKIEYAGDVAMRVADMIRQTLWGMLDACLLGQMVHAAGAFLASDMICNPVQAIAGIVTRELVAHLMSFAFQILS